MKRAARFCGLTIAACSLFASAARADVLAEYTYTDGDNFNPQNQGWTLGPGTEEDVNFFNQHGTSLLISVSAPPSVLISKTVPTNAFFGPWSMKGNNRFAGNSQEEFGMYMFADDGTNLWHMSFYNHGNDNTDGIYMGGDPNGPVLSNTATKVLAEPVDAAFPAGSAKNKPFDGFHDWALVDSDGSAGQPPSIFLDGVDQMVAAIPAPSMFPAGTVGWGTLNPFESGFFQTQHMIFEGDPNAQPPRLAGDYNGNHVVDAGDYAIWRKNVGTSNVLPNDPIGGTIGPAHYNQWRSNFGKTGGAAAATGVPEPQTLSLLAFGIVALWPTFRRVRRLPESMAAA